MWQGWVDCSVKDVALALGEDLECRWSRQSGSHVGRADIEVDREPTVERIKRIASCCFVSVNWDVVVGGRVGKDSAY